MAGCGFAVRRGFVLAAIACTASAQAQAQLQVYSGSCDGSAIAMVGSNRFATVSDEEPVIRTYSFGGGGDLPAQRLFLTSPLGLSAKEEGDFQAAAKIGDTIYWIASFGSGKDGGAEPSRRRFFATHMAPDGTLVPVGATESRRSHVLFDALVEERKLAAYDLAQAALLPPKSPKALNIEGLAANRTGGLVIGFRNPLAGAPGRALLVTLANPGQVVAAKQAPILSEVVTIQLGGRGVRDIVYRPAQSDYLILSGAVDEARDFALYRWSGDPKEDPKQVPIDFGDLNPEALTVLNDGRLLFLSDDGEVKMGQDAKTCKKMPGAQKQFRALLYRAPD